MSRVPRQPCDVASQRIGNAVNCCLDPEGNGCDAEADLGVALHALNLLAVPPVNGPIAPDDVVRQMAMGNPVIARFAADAGWAHVTAITAANDDGSLQVADPANSGPTPCTFAELGGNYEGSTGRWTTTYLTRRLPPAAPVSAPAFSALPELAPLNTADRITRAPIPLLKLDLDAFAAGKSLFDAASSGYEAVMTSDALRIQPEAGHRGRTREAPLRLRSLITQIERQRSTNDLRLVRIPGFHLTVLWQPATDGGFVTPLLPTPRFLQNKSYPAYEFVELLASQARRQLERVRATSEAWIAP